MNSEETCGKCRFYDHENGWCRRRAPSHRDPLEIVVPSYLQAISVALVKLAELDIADFDEDLQTEATEVYKPSRWPATDENSWCGEFQAEEMK
jgi:hypothetical protein